MSKEQEQLIEQLTKERDELKATVKQWVGISDSNIDIWIESDKLLQAEKSKTKELEDGLESLSEYYGNLKALHYFFFNHNTLRPELLNKQ